MTRSLLVALALARRSAAAPADTIQIVAFGDSATAGYLVARKDAYPAQLQAALRAKGYDVEVHNAGVNGDTTAGALRRFDMAIAPGTRHRHRRVRHQRPACRVPMKTVEARLTEIVRTLRARHIQVLVVGLGRLDLSAVARANGVALRAMDLAAWTIPRPRRRAFQRRRLRDPGPTACCRRSRR